MITATMQRSQKLLAQLACTMCCAFVLSRAQLHLNTTCSLCDRIACPSVLDCALGRRVYDACGCCEVCAPQELERCGGPLDVCDPGLLCIPIDPYDSEQLGTCQVVTPCLTFGCDSVDGTCHCAYSNRCPVREFSFYTIEECQEELQHSQCDDTDCPVVECPDIPGMTLNPGFTLPGECCPVGVECYCDCPPPKACPPGSVSVVTVAANETQELCCDVTDCEPAKQDCSYTDGVVAHGSRVRTDSCRTCECLDGQLVCHQESCLPIECPEIDRFTPPGFCCPICLISQTVLAEVRPPAVQCTSSSGEVYSVGESWQETSCRRCHCTDEGRSLCSSIQCELPKGCEPIYLADLCCPVCPEKAGTASTQLSATKDSTILHLFPTPEVKKASLVELPPPLQLPLLPSSCTSSSGKSYIPGESWQETPCKRCQCAEGGKVYCTAIQCELPRNCEPIFLPHICCPICPDEVPPALSSFSDSSSSRASSLSTLVPLVSLDSTSGPRLMLEISVVLAIPFDQYKKEQSLLLWQFERFLSSLGLESGGIKAQPYSNSQTDVQLTLFNENQLEIDVVAIVTDEMQALALSLAAKDPVAGELSGHEDNPTTEGLLRTNVPLVAGIITIAAVAALLSMFGIVVIVIVIVCRRRPKNKVMKVKATCTDV